jgi:hypothetical protein
LSDVVFNRVFASSRFGFRFAIGPARSWHPCPSPMRPHVSLSPSFNFPTHNSLSPTSLSFLFCPICSGDGYRRIWIPKVSSPLLLSLFLSLPFPSLRSPPSAPLHAAPGAPGADPRPRRHGPLAPAARLSRPPAARPMAPLARGPLPPAARPLAPLARGPSAPSGAAPQHLGGAIPRPPSSTAPRPPGAALWRPSGAAPRPPSRAAPSAFLRVAPRPPACGPLAPVRRRLGLLRAAPRPSTRGSRHAAPALGSAVPRRGPCARPRLAQRVPARAAPMRGD